MKVKGSMFNSRWLILFFCLLCLGATASFGLLAQSQKPPMHQAVEFLIFEMEPELRDRFLQIDRQHWTETLRRQKGFISKEVWVDELHPGQVTFVTYWESKALWKAIPAYELAETDRRFKAAFGHPFRLIEERHKTHHCHRVELTEGPPPAP